MTRVRLTGNRTILVGLVLALIVSACSVDPILAGTLHSARGTAALAPARYQSANELVRVAAWGDVTYISPDQVDWFVSNRQTHCGRIIDGMAVSDSVTGSSITPVTIVGEETQTRPITPKRPQESRIWHL
ncbi:MAG TPA: hypothetical protein VH681_05375 [Nitrospiraceae bacterium]